MRREELLSWARERTRGIRGRREFPGSRSYWQNRYVAGGNSGEGSYGRHALFKSDVLNDLVQTEGIESVLEFGCGDGAQLSLAAYPSYVGLDVAPAAVETCRRKFERDPTKSFFLYDPDHGAGTDELVADLALSLDVIYHLVEEDVYEAHIRNLFGSARQMVAIFSTDFDEATKPHIRHRRFTPWVREQFPEWELEKTIGADWTIASFFIYRRRPGSQGES